MKEAELITRDQAESAMIIHQERHMRLMELALENKADIQSFEKLVKLHNDFEEREARKMFFAGLSRFQSQLPIIEKKGKAGFDHRNGGGRTEYTYAKLEDIAKAIKPLLVENGLSYRYEQKHDPLMITVACVVTHKDGHEERTEMSGAADNSGKKNPIQQVASTVSYLRRYTMTGALGITVSDEDDDVEGLGVEPEGSGHEQQKESPYYPQDDFDTNLAKWTKLITEKKKEPEDILNSAKAGGINLSPGQIKTIEDIKVGE